jgi:hypothetical protein
MSRNRIYQDICVRVQLAVFVRSTLLMYVLLNIPVQLGFLRFRIAYSSPTPASVTVFSDI